MPYELFVYSELKAEKESDALKILFVTDEVVVSGYRLRRVENGIKTASLPGSRPPGGSDWPRGPAWCAHPTGDMQMHRQTHVGR